MRILIVGEHSATARIKQALSTVRDYSVVFEQSPEAAAAAIAGGRAELALVSIRGAVPADVNLALELTGRWRAPVVYVLNGHQEDAWARLRDTRPLAWISEPFDDVDLRVTVDLAMRKAAEDRRLRDEIRRAREAAALMAAESAVLAEQVTHIATLLGATPRSDEAPATNDASDELATLTVRERQIVDMVRQGGRVGSIAGELGLRAGTIRNHLSAAFRKLGVRSQEQLVALLRTASRGPMRHCSQSEPRHVRTPAPERLTADRQMCVEYWFRGSTGRNP